MFASILTTNDLMHQYSDSELIKGVLNGSPAHQVALYKQYSVVMFRVVLRFARDRSEAEDMLQEYQLRAADHTVLAIRPCQK